MQRKRKELDTEEAESKSTHPRESPQKRQKYTMGKIPSTSEDIMYQLRLTNYQLNFGPDEEICSILEPPSDSLPETNSSEYQSRKMTAADIGRPAVSLFSILSTETKITDLTEESEEYEQQLITPDSAQATMQAQTKCHAASLPFPPEPSPVLKHKQNGFAFFDMSSSPYLKDTAQEQPTELTASPLCDAYKRFFNFYSTLYVSPPFSLGSPPPVRIATVNFSERRRPRDEGLLDNPFLPLNFGRSSQ